MSEPTYEYVKGVGWVAGYDEIVTLACGTTVRVEHRPPDPGERYFYSRPGYAPLTSQDLAKQSWAFAEKAGYPLTVYQGHVESGYAFLVVKKA
jgi:hypothetical protein